MQQMREAEGGLAGRARQHHAACAEEGVLREKIIDQERQHEQRPQQRLIIAGTPCEGRIAADTRIGVVDRGDALAVRRAVAQPALADVGGFDNQVRGHREIAEQPFAFGKVGMARGDHVTESPHWNVAVAIRCGKQTPVFELIAQHRIGDVVGGEGEAVDFQQQAIDGQIVGGRKRYINEAALLEVVAGDDELSGCHVLAFGGLRARDVLTAGTLALIDVAFTTRTLFETTFGAGCFVASFFEPAMTPSRFFITL